MLNLVLTELEMKDTKRNYFNNKKYKRNEEVLGIMFTADRVQMSDEDIVQIYVESYK